MNEVKTYRINEVFASLQGEGVRSGTANVFVRMQFCNLRCGGVLVEDRGAYQPICDTEFASGRLLTLEEIHQWIREEDRGRGCKWLILTGGEPALQVDQQFCEFFRGHGFEIAIETNGTVDLTDLRSLLDWITVSPKVAEHAIKQRVADEVKYVRAYGQGIPETKIQARHYLISPAFVGDTVERRTLDWCVQLCLDNPPWRLSVQLHKWLNIR